MLDPESYALWFSRVTCNGLTDILSSKRKNMSMIQEFKEFAMKGSLIDMAVGIIIGAAVGKMVSTLVENILMPIIGVFMGGVNFSDLSITVGDAAIGYGAFIQSMIDFLIVAFVIFIILRAITSMKKKFEEEKTEEPAVVAEDVKLLEEIRDLLKQGR
ncbi:Large-conductance mechanosensitive channel [Granulosicoccus antarcticus IMCC3135]|uniref:Large-conductance mechanosensitive channel n=2 Tax=Granulosicoccus TaxID=437504 RepID=A0A2Z2NVA4_9GAMM|nr:Large-conductance mechanosensitive channel [Granulosicoccus antarcticus IMCC3135]